MNKKTECEIVQDLLISYADDVLNVESKKLVEKHLMKCEKCQEKLSEIRNDFKESKINEQAQIDYLKKVRLKSRIKSILWAIVILGMIFAGWYFYQFSMIHRMSRKIEKQFESENFYIETISTTGIENELMNCKTWYKDGNYKIAMQIESEGEIIQKFDTEYGNIVENTKEAYFVNESEKKVRKEKLLFEKGKNEFICSQSPFLLKNAEKEFGKSYIIMKLGEPFFVKISTDHKEIGRQYYVLNFGETKKWIDMDTGLPIMSFGDVVSTDYYTGTKIPKKRTESISEYHYAFETVTDEDVKMPDLEGFEMEEFDWETEIEKLKK